MMKINIYRRDECFKAEGLCVVIDVLRAFTTAAFAFSAGAQEITLVATTKEAFDMRREDNSLVLMGEENGRPIAGFDYGNSPDEIQRSILTGHRVIQRSSEGTQGVVNCNHAERLMITSFVVAEATLRHILALSPSIVSFIVTGVENGDEDLALAEYLQCRLLKQDISPSSFLERVRLSPAGRKFADPDKIEFSPNDLELALQIDRFPFAMEVEKQNGSLVAKKAIS